MAVDTAARERRIFETVVTIANLDGRPAAVREIASKCGCSIKTAGKVLRELIAQGAVSLVPLLAGLPGIRQNQRGYLPADEVLTGGRNLCRCVESGCMLSPVIVVSGKMLCRQHMRGWANEEAEREFVRQSQWGTVDSSQRCGGWVPPKSVKKKEVRGREG